jgi:hypothetical protein
MQHTITPPQLPFLTGSAHSQIKQRNSTNISNHGDPLTNEYASNKPATPPSTPNFEESGVAECRKGVAAAAYSELLESEELQADQNVISDMAMCFIKAAKRKGQGTPTSQPAISDCSWITSIRGSQTHVNFRTQCS